MMKHLNIPFTKAVDHNSAIQDISDYLDQLQKNSIENAPWPEYNYKPKVAFSIAHSNDNLFLKYYVSENAIRAVYSNINSPVHKDSCVEFFILFNDERNYYNFEFNCIGTCHAGFGKDRHGRESLPDEVLSKIKSMTVVKRTNDIQNNISWELTIMIPVTAFTKHNLTQLNGLKGQGNFFKCGDDLPVPHFLAWNNIEAETPDFHLSKYFGKLEFA